MIRNVFNRFLSAPILSTDKFLNVKTFGNIFYLKVNLDYKVILLALLPFLLQPLVDFILSEKALSEFSLQSIASAIFTLCLIFLFGNYKNIVYFMKKYLNNGPMFFIIAIESCITLFLFLALNEFIIYAFLGAFFWLFSGVLRGIIQYSKALYKENPSEMAELIKIYGVLRFSYFFVFVLLLMDLFKKMHMIDILLNLNYQDVITFDVLFRLFFLFAALYLFLLCVLNLYPYIMKTPAVQTSVELIQFISSSKKGCRFNEMSSKFNNLNESELKQYLDSLVYVDYIRKDNRYRLSPHYSKILNDY